MRAVVEVVKWRGFVKIRGLLRQLLPRKSGPIDKQAPSAGKICNSPCERFSEEILYAVVHLFVIEFNISSE